MLPGGTHRSAREKGVLWWKEGEDVFDEGSVFKPLFVHFFCFC